MGKLREKLELKKVAFQVPGKTEKPGLDLLSWLKLPKIN